jgi:hypothetical protein
VADDATVSFGDEREPGMASRRADRFEEPSLGR